MKKRPILTILVSSGIGAVLGYFAYHIWRLDILQITPSQHLVFILIGSLAGVVIGICYFWYISVFSKFKLEEVKLTVPEFSQMTFRVNIEFRKVAWNLFVEVITRIATQPLDPDAGYLREALSSLYSLFTTTRQLLKGMMPVGEADGTTVELFAISMLNEVIRPFLSKWHPILAEHEAKEPKAPESEWEFNQQFRGELEKLRINLLKYARGFGEIAGVEQLDMYFE